MKKVKSKTGNKVHGELHGSIGTVDDFIKELQRISADKRKLPLVVQCPNGELTYPSIKMVWDDPMKMFETIPDKMWISWR